MSRGNPQTWHGETPNYQTSYQKDYCKNPPAPAGVHKRPPQPDARDGWGGAIAGHGHAHRGGAIAGHGQAHRGGDLHQTMTHTRAIMGPRGSHASRNHQEKMQTDIQTTTEAPKRGGNRKAAPACSCNWAWPHRW